MQYSGMKTVEFPDGTLLTPAAKDWAAEHELEVVIGQNGIGSINACASHDTEEKAELLKQTVKAVMRNMDRSGGLLTKNELVKIVVSSLEKMGCTIENR